MKEGDGDAQILRFVSAHDGQPGIVYRGTRKAVEKTAAFLSVAAGSPRWPTTRAWKTRTGARGRRRSCGTR